MVPPADQVEPADTADVPEMPAEGEAPVAEAVAGDGGEEVTDTIPEASEQETAVGARPESEAGEPEMEVFYTFTWVGNRPRREGNKPRKQGGPPRGKGPKGKPKRGQPENPGRFSSAPPKKDRIDPDNPFAAALMGLKDKS